MASRPNKPLFELLRDSSREAPSRPMPVRVEAPAQPRAERAARHEPPSGHGASSGPRSYIPVSQNAIYMGIALGLVLLVIAYAVGFTVGKNRAAADYRQRVAAQQPPPAVIEPGSTPTLPASAARREPAWYTTPAPAPARATPPQFVLSADGRILSSRGNLANDPREVGLNYLSLAILNPQDTQAAINFLSANGVEAIGVPLIDAVDRRRSTANNLPSYLLVVLQGITGAEYGQRQPIRTDLEQAVERLGAAWQKEHRGSSNFAKHSWDKYKG